MPIANGLFHRWPGVREAAIEVLQNLQQYPVSLASTLIASILFPHGAGSA